MISPEYCRLMSAYNRWMNERLFVICSDIPDSERKLDRGAFFRSIHGTLNHLLLADRLWLGRFTAQPFAATSLNQELYADWDELQSERALTDAAIEDWVLRLDERGLAAPFSYTSMVNPELRTYPLWFCVAHFFNHQAHHRGQLTTLMNQIGFDSDVTDLLMLPNAPRLA